ncbi:hypothetical protein D3C76_1199750 [compost metagenome]
MVVDNATLASGAELVSTTTVDGNFHRGPARQDRRTQPVPDREQAFLSWSKSRVVAATNGRTPWDHDPATDCRINVLLNVYADLARQLADGARLKNTLDHRALQNLVLEIFQLTTR